MDIQNIASSDWMQSLLGVATNAFSKAPSGADSSGKVDFSKMLMQQLDTDNDGQISEQEMNYGVGKVQNSLSQLNDISSQMRASGVKGQTEKTAAKLLNQIDANGNGSVDISESGLTQTQFNQIDTDGDGKLSVAELRAVIDKSNGTARNSKIKASQSDCSSILSVLQSQGVAQQYAASKSSSSTTSSSSSKAA